MPNITSKATMMFLLAGVLWLVRAEGATDPMQLSGYAPQTVQQGGDTGAVNVMSGNLTLSAQRPNIHMGSPTATVIATA